MNHVYVQPDVMYQLYCVCVCVCVCVTGHNDFLSGRVELELTSPTVPVLRGTHDACMHNHTDTHVCAATRIHTHFPLAVWQ